MTDPIPPNIWAVIKSWYEQRKTGQLSLNWSEGQILNAELKEKVKAS